MRKIATVFLAAFLLAGCAEQEAKTALKGILTDPGSAKFSGLKKGTADGNVCGFFNAKNRMGGYAGNTPFFYEKLIRHAVIVEGVGDRDFERLWRALDRGNFSEEYAEVRGKCYLVERWVSVCGFDYPSNTSSLCSAFEQGGESLYSILQDRFSK